MYVGNTTVHDFYRNEVIIGVDDIVSPCSVFDANREQHPLLCIRKKNPLFFLYTSHLLN